MTLTLFFLQTSTIGTESSSAEALRNVVILREIFAHCSSRLLLRSISLVNKSWNYQARTFIRNHRKCFAKDPQDGSWSTSEFIENLDQLCAQIYNKGREIPLNGLKIDLYRGGQGRLEDFKSDGTIFNRLPPAGLKLQHLEIVSLLPITPNFPISVAVELFLQSNSVDLKSLYIANIIWVQERFSSIAFPKLEELCVSAPPPTFYDPEITKESVTKMLKNAPKLKRIFAKNLETFKLVPEEKHELLGNVHLRFDNPDEDGIFREILEKKPKLTELSVFEPEESDDSRPEFFKLLKQCLQNYHEELKSIRITDGFSTPELFSSYPLVNLSKFTFTASHDRHSIKIHDFWNAIASIKFQEVMPKLEEMRIQFSSVYMTQFTGQWPRNNHKGEPYNSSDTVWKLTLELRDGTLNMIPFKTMFPNVTWLEVTMTKWWSIPYSEIWELWPHLEYLKVTGEEHSGQQSFDSEICGIHAEEAKLLREMDEEDLKVVHNVPVRPCLLTMSCKY